MLASILRRGSVVCVSISTIIMLSSAQAQAKPPGYRAGKSSVSTREAALNRALVNRAVAEVRSCQFAGMFANMDEPVMRRAIQGGVLPELKVYPLTPGASLKRAVGRLPTWKVTGGDGTGRLEIGTLLPRRSGATAAARMNIRIRHPDGTTTKLDGVSARKLVTRKTLELPLMVGATSVTYRVDTKGKQPSYGGGFNLVYDGAN